MKVNSKSAGFITLTVILLSAFFFYFFTFNRYHLWHLEQNQLFRYNKDYLLDFLQRPGGFILLTGAFITRFFYNAWVAAITITFLAGSFFYITSRILKYYQLSYFLLSAITVVILAALQSNHNYLPAYTLGWLFTITVFYGYILIPGLTYRHITGLILVPVLFYLCGFFSFLLVPLVIVHELSIKGKKHYLFCLTMVITGMLMPVVFQRYVFLTPKETMWIIPLNPVLLKDKSVYIFLLPCYLVIIIASIPFIRKIKVTRMVLAISALLFLISGFFIIRENYDKKNEVFLHIEASYQQSDYKQVLALGRKYPGNNQLVVYYTNLALSRLGELSEKMFMFNQSGSRGLWLQWSRNETAPLYGSEFYEIVGYTNEASRWAFEAMEINELNPRSLKKLIIASLINEQPELASKYRYLLSQNSHYASWSDDKKVANGKKMKLTHDFISTGYHPYELLELLEDHPDNRPAYEYLMASFLLDKNLEMFASQIYRLKDLGYSHIPRYFEEAIILYSGLTGKDITPPGYTLSEQTMQRFHEYASLFAANRYSMDKASKVLAKKFGDTFWYYMQFRNQK
ncbi:MAG TPA: DUF6057 family protein [Bacteroidales bacterium]|nr:DUF6057 family protein [Bacteroidales bacterium]